MANTDRRLQDRALHKGELSEEEIAHIVLELPDDAEGIGQPNAEDLDRLREELVSEASGRRERIERSLSEPTPTVTPFIPAAPLDDEL